jgi:HK97 family phage major capsid protein
LPEKTKVDELIDKTTEVLDRVEQSETSWQKDLHDVKATVDEIKENRTGVTQEQVRELLDEALTKQEQEKITNRLFTNEQSSAIKVPDPWSDAAGYFEYGYGADELARKALEERDNDAKSLLFGMQPQDDAHKAFCRMGIDVQILDGFGRHAYKNTYGGFAKTFPKTAQKWAWYQERFYQHMTGKAASDAMDLTDTANWVPTGWATEMRELIMLQLRVAALFQRFNMPNSPFELPLNLTDDYGNYVPETTAIVDPYATTGTAAAQIQALSDSKKTFAARKLRARIMTSGELVEDAIVAMLPLIRNQLVKILANTQEYAIINGQVSGGIDTGYSAGAFDCREAWDGIRKIANARSAEVDFNSTWSTANMLALRKELGELGVETGQLAYIPSPIGYLNIIGIAEVLTVDKYGGGATILTGEQGQFAGVPIVISRWMPENLNASGVYDGVTVTKTVVSLVRRDAFLIGDKRNVTVEQERIIQTDQYDLVAMQRMDFEAIWTADKDSAAIKVCATGYDLAAA